MKEFPSAPGFWQRATAVVLFAAPSALVVWVTAVNGFFLMRWLIAFFFLAFASVIFAAVWRHGFDWFFSRKALRFHAGVALALISLVVLFYSEESWRGKRAWAALQREASARGESLEFSSLTIPAIPDDQNFAKAPGVAGLLENTNSQPFYHGTADKWRPTGWVSQQFTDLVWWQKFFRNRAAKSVMAKHGTNGLTFPATPEPQTPAADVLFALGKFETNLAVLRAASQRPELRLPIDCNKGFFLWSELNNSPLQSLNEAAHLLSLRASAELQQGQSEAALQDVLLALRLGELVSKEPSYFTYRRPWDIAQFYLQPIWEGLAAHRWNDAQLAALQEKLNGVDMSAEYRHCLRGETLAIMNLFDQWLAYIADRPTEFARRVTPLSPKEDDGFVDWVARMVIKFYPVGWLYQDKVWIYRFYQRHTDPLITVALRNQPQQKWNAGNPVFADPIMAMFAPLALRGDFQGTSVGFLTLRTFVEQAAAACALERFRLAQGKYPETLETLVPDYLQQIPADYFVPTAAQLKYLRTPDGGFKLYSVGFGGRNDGGKPNPSINPQQNLFWPLSEDVVWIQPGKR